MLIIRQKQMAALSEVASGAWVPEMMAHARRHFPSETDDRSDDTLRDHIHRTQELARKFGFAGKRDHFRLLNLTILYGCDWQTDARLQWMYDCLHGRSHGTPEESLAYVVRQCRYGRND